MNPPDYFELFGLPRGFEVDLQDLELRWKDRASAVHPDRFAAASEAEKRVAMQWSASMNEAYRVLRDPLRRAQYLCQLAGYPTENQSGVSMDVEFLGRQMQWREDLQEIRSRRDPTALAKLSERIEQDRLAMQKDAAQLIQEQRWKDALERLNEWMFVEKFLQEIKSAARALNAGQQQNG